MFAHGKKFLPVQGLYRILGLIGIQKISYHKFLGKVLYVWKDLSFLKFPSSKKSVRNLKKCIYLPKVSRKNSLQSIFQMVCPIKKFIGLLKLTLFS